MGSSQTNSENAPYAELEINAHYEVDDTHYEVDAADLKKSCTVSVKETTR